jgi:hypothetical protein
MRRRPVAEVTSAEHTSRLLDALEAQMHTHGGDPQPIDRAVADAFIRGAGYLKFTEDGKVEHVPFDRVQIT